MKDVGFVDVSTKTYNWAWSRCPWPQYPGCDVVSKYTIDELRPVLCGMIGKVFEGSRYDTEEVKRFQEQAMKDTDMDIGGHKKFYVVTGRKPS